MTDNGVHLPGLNGADQADVVAWHVSVGDHVVAGQPLVSVATRDTVIEIPAPRSGRVGALVAKPGQYLHPGDRLLTFADSGEDRGAVVGNLPDEEPKP